MFSRAKEEEKKVAETVPTGGFADRLSSTLSAVIIELALKPQSDELILKLMPIGIMFDAMTPH